MTMGGAGATTAAMREEDPDMMEAATTRVAEATAARASTMMTITVATAKGMDVKTWLAEVRGTKSPRTALRHLPQ